MKDTHAITGCIYISGQMTGLPELNFPAFNAAAAKLRAMGCKVFNPAENPEQETWEDYMRIDIRAITHCSAIYMLPGWEKSRGARLEHHVAKELGLLVLEGVA